MALCLIHGHICVGRKEAVIRKIISTLIIALWICGKLLKMLDLCGFPETILCEKLSQVIHNVSESS